MSRHLHNWQLVRVTSWSRIKANVKEALFMCHCGKTKRVQGKL